MFHFRSRQTSRGVWSARRPVVNAAQSSIRWGRLPALALGLALSVGAGELVLRGLDLPERWLPGLAPIVGNEGGLLTPDPALLFAPTTGHCADCAGSGKPWTSSPRSITVHPTGARREGGSEAKPEGTYRILAVGGSNTFGAETSDGQSWPDYLQTRLNAAQPRPVEVWNFGVSGWETSQKVAALRVLVPRMQADAVVLQLHNLGPRFMLEGSDPVALVRADGSLLEDWIPHVPRIGGAPRWLWDRSRLLQLPWYAAERLRRARNPDGGLPERTILSTHERGLASLRTWLGEHPELPVLLLVPVPGVQDHAAGALRDFAALGRPVLDLSGAAQPFGDEGEHIHPGAQVHDWYAARIAEVVTPDWLASP